MHGKSQRQKQLIMQPAAGGGVKGISVCLQEAVCLLEGVFFFIQIHELDMHECARAAYLQD